MSFLSLFSTKGKIKLRLKLCLHSAHPLQWSSASTELLGTCGKLFFNNTVFSSGSITFKDWGFFVVCSLLELPESAGSAGGTQHSTAQHSCRVCGTWEQTQPQPPALSGSAVGNPLEMGTNTSGVYSPSRSLMVYSGMAVLHLKCPSANIISFFPILKAFHIHFLAGYQCWGGSVAFNGASGCNQKVCRVSQNPSLEWSPVRVCC